MKAILLPVFLLVGLGVYAQQGKTKVKNKDINKPVKVKENKVKVAKERNHDVAVWDGTGYKPGKASKNIPAKVRESFLRDYPFATNVYWTKYRGDWTATFTGSPFRCTAVYHANGQRRDTRTFIPTPQWPRPVLDGVYKTHPQAKVEDVIKIEVPEAVKDIFRIKTIIDNKPSYLFYNADGAAVTYSY